MAHGPEWCAHGGHDCHKHAHRSEAPQDTRLVLSSGKIHPQNDIDVWSCVHVPAGRDRARAAFATADLCD
eukprot:2225277-Alexandrium_andersonii.AAC.1